MSYNSDIGGKYRKNWDPAQHYKDIQIAERYDQIRFSGLSGRVFDRLEKRALRRAFADVPTGARVMDAPCGTGRLAEVLLGAGYRVVGVDISEAMLEVARRRLARFGDRFEARVVDIRELDVLEGTFDAALCARVLMHFPLSEQIQFLGAVTRASRGPVIFNQSLDTSYHRLRRKFKRLLRNSGPAAFPVTEADLSDLLAGCGLRQGRRHYVLPMVSEAAMITAEKMERTA